MHFFGEFTFLRPSSSARPTERRAPRCLPAAPPPTSAWNRAPAGLPWCAGTLRPLSAATLRTFSPPRPPCAGAGCASGGGRKGFAWKNQCGPVKDNLKSSSIQKSQKNRNNNSVGNSSNNIKNSSSNKSRSSSNRNDRNNSSRSSSDKNNNSSSSSNTSFPT